MARFVAFDAILFLLPFAAYAAFLTLTRGSLRNAEDWQIKTIAYLAIAGAGLLIVALVVFISYSGTPPDGIFVPAHIENGKIVPGRIDPGPAAPQ
ncbi:MAG: DUF6111 family protein [Bauldia sp.]